MTLLAEDPERSLGSYELAGKDRENGKGVRARRGYQPDTVVVSGRMRCVTGTLLTREVIVAVDMTVIMIEAVTVAVLVAAGGVQPTGVGTHERGRLTRSARVRLV